MDRLAQESLRNPSGNFRLPGLRTARPQPNALTRARRSVNVSLVAARVTQLFQIGLSGIGRQAAMLRDHIEKRLLHFLGHAFGIAADI